MSTDTFEQQTTQAWDDLRDRLAQWLGDPPDEETVVIELPWPDDGGGGTAPYVQVLVEDGALVHAEAVSNRFLARQFRLDKPRRRALRALGWQRPSGDVDNYWWGADLPGCAEDVADLLVATLREVYGVPAPAFLVVGGFAPNGPLAREVRPFGLAKVQPQPREVDLTVAIATSPDELRDLVAGAVSEVTDIEVRFDADGDIPVPAGDTVIYVRVEEDSPSVRLFAPLLHEVKWTPRVGHTLNDVNQHLRYAKVTHESGYLVVNAHLPCLPFVPEQLRQALTGMSGMVDGLGSMLRRQIGGLLLSESADGEA